MLPNVVDSERIKRELIHKDSSSSMLFPTIFKLFMDTDS